MRRVMCENCSHELDVGIYQICIAAVTYAESGRVTAKDCVVSRLHEPWPEEVGCMWCKYTFKLKTERCQECVSKPHFPRFVRRYESGVREGAEIWADKTLRKIKSSPEFEEYKRKTGL